MKITKANTMGMDVEICTFESCRATIGIGPSWATIYSMESKEPGKGHGNSLIIQMRNHYEAQGKKFGSTVALSKAMKHLLEKHNIVEYAEAL